MAIPIPTRTTSEKATFASVCRRLEAAINQEMMTAPGGPRDGLNLVLCFAALGLFGIPAAGFLVLPHVLISQLIDEDEGRTGASRAAMFFGMQGFFTKWMYGISLWLFTLLLSRHGNSPEEPGGVILVGSVAAACSLLALIVYSRYPEREVLSAGSA